jgi:hypothetical protein
VLTQYRNQGVKGISSKQGCASDHHCTCCTSDHFKGVTIISGWDMGSKHP